MEIINLDMTPSTVTPNAHAGQYDASRTVRFMLKNGGVPFTLAGTETITAEITRSDNTEVTVNVANTSSNYVDVVFDDTVCTVKGLYACELRLKDSDGFDIGSKNFALLVQRDPYDGAGVRIVTVGPADICTFETTLTEPYQSVLVNVLATGGNGTPDSPNPINGYTEANITRCGVNLWNGTKQDNVGVNATTGNLYASTGTFTTDYIKVAPNTAYYANPTNWKTWACFYDASKTYVNYTSIVNGVINTTAEAVYMRISGDMNEVSTACINYPATDTAYHPYTGNTYTVAFGQTVYGGVLDVTRGKLHVDKAYKDLGALNYTMYSVAQGNLFRSDEFDIKRVTSTTEAPDIISSIFVAVASANRANYTISMINNTARIDVIDDDYSDAVAFKSAMSGVQIVYPLETPFDIDLTPAQINALALPDSNNVFADCGETTVKYLKAGE